MSIKERLKTAFERAKAEQKLTDDDDDKFLGMKQVRVASTFVFSLIL